jgi:sensitive to high expression protein 9
MSLIRSEHLNDKAVREAKDAVEAAENALEEARSYLEKRERAQYHEEQIWSDTIRRNSTWVTFGLMGVNIFLLLLSLLILEPWRRRRMVREIKSALEAQQATAEAAVAPALAAPYVVANPVTEPSVATSAATAAPAQEPSEPQVVVEEASGLAPTAAPPASPASPASPVATGASIDESPTAETADLLRITDEHGNEIGNVIDEVVEPTTDPAVLGAAPLMPENAEVTPQETLDIQKEAWESLSTSEKVWAKLGLWKNKAAIVAEDIVSDRPISMRRVDFTTAILQGAAAGAVIAAASIALLLRPN